MLNGNHGIAFKIYVACCLIFVWGSIFLTLGFFALLFLVGVTAGVGNSVA